MRLHRFDLLSFIAGALTTAIGLAFLLLRDLGQIVDALTDAGTWFWPVLFIAVGVAVLAPLAGRTTDNADGDDPERTVPD